MVDVEAAILVELLAFLSSLSRFSVVGVKLVMQMYVLGLIAAADKICVLLQGVSFSHIATGCRLNAALCLHSLCNL